MHAGMDYLRKRRIGLWPWHIVLDRLDSNCNRTDRIHGPTGGLLERLIIGEGYHISNIKVRQLGPAPNFQ
jgi:hypothetical protein